MRFCSMCWKRLEKKETGQWWWTRFYSFIVHGLPSRVVFIHFPTTCSAHKSIKIGFQTKTEKKKRNKLNKLKKQKATKKSCCLMGSVVGCRWGCSPHSLYLLLLILSYCWVSIIVSIVNTLTSMNSLLKSWWVLFIFSAPLNRTAV